MISSANVIFKASELVKVSKYSIATATDTGTNPGSNPVEWTLSACTNYAGENTSWTVIDTVTDGGLPVANETYIDYDLEETTQFYQYFKLEITKIDSGDVLQISEIALKDYILCEHQWEANGFCTICGGYESAVFDETDNRYEISNVGQLYWFAQQVNGGNNSINAVLTSDITVNTGDVANCGGVKADGWIDWTPIGWYEMNIGGCPYSGTFDGQGHTISGLYYNNTDKTTGTYVGLFGYIGYVTDENNNVISTGKVSNVGVVDSYFNGYGYVGGVCGYNSSGTIENCYNTGRVSGNSLVGGVCGYNYTVTATATITNCYNTGKVSGKNGIGGVCGHSFGSKIESCYNTGDVTATVITSNVGGVCGYNYSGGTIENCYSTGKVSGKNRVGGVCGYNSGTITNCYSTGTVSGTGDNVGGVCGYNYTATATITNCYYDGDKYSGDAVGGGSGTVTDVEGKTTAQFTSGEVAYLLNGSTSEGTLVWGQLLGEDDFPVLDGTKKVYQVERHITCLNVDEIVYSNTDAPIYLDHNYDENGFCQHDSEVFYQPATLTTDKYDLNNDNVKDEVYEISNAGQLYWFAGLVNGTLEGVVQDRTANAVLTADITVNTGDVANCNGTKETGWIDWTPINVYRGIFDGQGHTISGLYFSDSTAEDVGLFGLNYGTIQNVGVINSYFVGLKYVGGVCGENYKGTITNCYNTGTVGASSHFGGVCGYNYGSITNCYNRGTVNGSFYMGGEFSGVSYFGGVCGYNNFGTITNCYYDGDKYKLYAVGYNNGGTVSKTVLCQTTEQFASGEVAYFLSQGCTAGETTYGGSIWGQTIGTEDYPVLGDAKVYQIDVYEGCEVNPGNASTGYANTDAPVYAEHSMTEHSANAATCKNPGNYAYWTCSYENGVYYKDEERTDTFSNLAATVIPALEHEDIDNDGYCNNGCGQPVRPIVKEVSATLNGDIGLNYYIALPESVKADEGAYVQFNVNGENTKVYVKDATAEEDGTYKFTCWLTAKEMRDTVTFELYDGSGTNVDIYKNSGEKIEGASFDYSLETYFDALSSDEDAALKALADATLIYGAYAQNAFNHNADPTLNGSELADVTVDTLETNKMTKSADIPEGLKLTEMTLILETETILRLYFKSDNIGNYTFKLDGNDVTLNTIAEEGLYYVELVNISAKDFDTMHTLEINGECTLTFNALSYAYAVLKTSNNDDLCNVVKALYKYNEAANAYFSN